MDIDRVLTWMKASVDSDFTAPPVDEALARRVLTEAAGRNLDAHLAVLHRWNGFYALGGLLHVLGACSAPPNHSLEAWNSPDGWRRAYGMRTDGIAFFAQDAFGDQFGYRGGKVVRLRAQTGTVEGVAITLVEWLETVLVEPDYTLSRKAYQECVAAHGALPHGGLFYVPVMQGGLFDVQKVQVTPRRDGMEMLAVAAANSTRRPSSVLRSTQKMGG